MLRRRSKAHTTAMWTRTQYGRQRLRADELPIRDRGPSPRRDTSFTSRLAALALTLLPLIFMPLHGHAQEATESVRPRRVWTQAEEVATGEVIRVDTDLIPVEAVVRDATGRAVRGLRAGDFRLFEDGVERPISFFSAETGCATRCPLDLVFALDVSGSMTRDETGMLRKAAAVFKDRLSGLHARFAVVSFGMRVKLLQAFTADQQRLDRAFDSAFGDEMGLSTHAYDAVDDAVRLLARQGRKSSGGAVVKRAVVVISDGFPTGDIVSPRTVIERANAANVSIYSVTMPSFSFGYGEAYGKPLPTMLDLSGLVEKTGGVNVYATGGGYDEALRAISEEVMSRYVLAFYPGRGKRRDGNFHQLRVEVSAGLTVTQSRRQYTGVAGR